MSVLTVSVSKSFNRPCMQVWELITDTSRWPEWGPSVSAVQSGQRFISRGSSGKIKTALGIWVPYTIGEYEENRYWAWKVAGIPATGHRITSQEKETCKLTFEIPVLAAPYALVCRIALDRIAGILDKKERG